MKLNAAGNVLTLETAERMNSGTVNWHRAEFNFDEAWAGMTRTVAWHTVYGDWAQLLDGESCLVPWEALDHAVELAVAVFGVRDGNVVLTTDYVSLGRVIQGADPADRSVEPTPAAYETLVELSAHAPRIGAAGAWEIWNIGQKAYVSTGVLAGGGGVESLSNLELEEILR